MNLAMCRLLHWKNIIFVERPRSMGSWQDRLKCEKCGNIHWITKARQ